MLETIHLPIEDFQRALLEIDRVRAADIFEKVHKGSESFEALEHLTMEVLERIGDGWEDGEVSLSQVYMSGIICEELIEQYIPKYLVSYKDKPKMAIAVLQDHHALGKRIVYSVLRAGGYNLMDFGQGLSVEDLVEKTVAEEIEILLISTLMLPSALKVKKVVEGLREKGSSANIIVGGAPFRLDEHLWQKVKADADGRNGTEVIKIIGTLTKEIGGQQP